MNVAYHWDLESIIFSPSYFFLILQLNPWYPYKLVTLKNYLKIHCFNLIGLGRVAHFTKAWEFVVSLFFLFNWAMCHHIQPLCRSIKVAFVLEALQLCKSNEQALLCPLVGLKVQIWAVKMSYLASWSAHPCARKKDAMFSMKLSTVGYCILGAWEGKSHWSLCS